MNKVKMLCLVGAAVLAMTVRAASPVTVTQKGLKFSVEALSVDKGQVVQFLNDDRTAHNITVSGQGFSINGGLQRPGDIFKVPFTKAGVYQVTCGIHPKMKMSVTVK